MQDSDDDLDSEGALSGEEAAARQDREWDDWGDSEEGGDAEPTASLFELGKMLPSPDECEQPGAAAASPSACMAS